MKTRGSSCACATDLYKELLGYMMHAWADKGPEAAAENGDDEKWEEIYSWFSEGDDSESESGSESESEEEGSDSD